MRSALNLCTLGPVGDSYCEVFLHLVPFRGRGVAPRVEVELSSVLRSGRHLWARQDVGGRDRVYSLELCVRGLFVLVFGDLS